MSRADAAETLLICDGCTLTVDRVPEGKFKVRSVTGVIDTVILADHALELPIRQGQVQFCAGGRCLTPRTSSQTGSLGARPPMTSDVTSLHGRGVSPSRGRDVTPSRARFEGFFSGHDRLLWAQSTEDLWGPLILEGPFLLAIFYLFGNLGTRLP